MSSANVSVTLLYGGFSALLLLVLGMYTSVQRGKHKVFIGDTPPPELQRVIRAHGNAAEYIPIGVILLLILELSGVGPLPLHVLGGAFLLGRLLHAFGVITKSPLSAAGAGINYLSLVTMGGWAVAQHFMK